MFDTPLTKQDQEFIDTIEGQINDFLKTNESMLELDPMNSYRRRLVHKLASAYNLKSQSVGDSEERYVCVIRTEKSAPPAKTAKAASGPTFTYDMVYPVKPGSKIRLRTDGSFGVDKGEEKLPLLDERVVEAKAFRIVNSKIIVPGEDGW